MDDQALSEPRRGAGRTAGWIVLGAAVGLAVGWLVWRGGGPADAPITIVEFSDFQCPFCSRFAQSTAPALRRHYGDRIRWIFVNYPLRSIHPNAYEAALAGECAGEQDRFWPFYDALFGGRYELSSSGYSAVAREIGLDEERFETCYRNADHAPEVALDIQEGEKFYILGTPTFYVNGKRMEGAQRPEAFAAVIDSILVN